MIKAEGVTKKFGDFVALDNISCTIPEGCIYGLVGSNGSGKSTFLRAVSGIYRADAGDITLDGEKIFDNPNAKSKIVFVSEDMFFINSVGMKRMAQLYASVYDNFDMDKFEKLAKQLNLNLKKNVNSFSKGMKRQAAVILAVCANTSYMFFDETFDGLDPIMRNTVRKIISAEMLDRRVTAVVSTHSLKELENICDRLAILHRGKVIFEDDTDNLQTSLFKVQVAFDREYDQDEFEALEILKFTKTGFVSELIVRGEKDLTEVLIKAKKPVLFNVLNLSLEEVFTYEMSLLGYEFDDVLEVDDNEE